MDKLESCLNTSDRPKVAVLMATFNGAPWIEEQILSILSQVDVDVHLFVMDDSSSDDTVAIVTKFHDIGKNVTLLSSHSRSGSAGQNFIRLIRSMELAEFTHFSLSDQDDVWDISKLCRGTNALRDTGCDLYSSAVRAGSTFDRTCILTQSARLTEVDYFFEGAGQGCTFLLTTKLFEQVRELLRRAPLSADKIHYHDWLIYSICRAGGFRWFYDVKPSMWYRQHGSNDTGSRRSWAGLAKRYKLLSTGWYCGQINAIASTIRHFYPNDQGAAKFYLNTQHLKKGVAGRLRGAFWLLTSSRRRLSDRLALSIFSLFNSF